MHLRCCRYAGGSQGYGRVYRQRLAGNWGVVDVSDCCNGAKHIAQLGLADPEKLCIDGGSAGGFTVLAALAFKDVFKAGCAKYGISDLTSLAQETHKFESRYLDRLVGPVCAAQPAAPCARSGSQSLCLSTHRSVS